MKKLFFGSILIMSIQSSYAQDTILLKPGLRVIGDLSTYKQDTLLLKTGQKVIGKLKSIEGSVFVLKVGDSTIAYERNEIEAFYLGTSIQMKNDVANDAKKKADKKKNK